MTDENEESKQSEVSTDYVKVVEQKDQEIAAMRIKMDELLNETKTAKAKAREIEEAKSQAEADRARKNGDYKQLLESSEQGRKQLEEQLDSLRNKVSSEKIKSVAMKIATELADGPNAEIMGDIISRRLRYTEEGIRPTTETGELTVSSLDTFKMELASDAKYKSLLRGNQSSGGSATGDGGSAPGSNQVERAAFDKMSSEQRTKFMNTGGKVI